MQNATRWLLMLGLVCGVMACGDSRVDTNAPLDPDRVNGPDGTPNVSKEYFLVAAGESSFTVNVGTQAPLGAFLYSKRSGGPVQDENVTYEIIETSVPDVASLSALNGTTDENGNAEVTLRASSQEGTVKIRASHPASNWIEFDVVLEPAATGNIQVSLANSAPSILTLRNIDVRLHAAEGYSCNEFLPLRQPHTSIAETRVSTVEETVPFDSQGTTGRYIITGVARGPAGQIAAGGCVEDVRVAPNETTNVEVTLALIPLNPVGRYKVTSNWDFSEAVANSGPVGSTIVDVLNVFVNPGRALYDGVIDLVTFAVGGLIGGAINSFLGITGLDDRFESMINNAIAGNDTLRKVQQAGLDLRDVIANLEITSELTIGKLSSSYEFTGTDNWLGITLYWRWNCDANSPPDCGAIPIVAEDGSDFANLGVLSSVWNGRVVAYNQLQIDTHPLTLRYGRLIIYVLNNVILPQLTDGMANSLSDAFAYWVGCPNLARRITESVGNDPNKACALGACISRDQLEGFCSDTVSTLFGFADALITNLEFDVGLSVGGEGKLVELDSDGFVDKIEDGIYQGNLSTANQMGGTSAAPFTATWSAVKVDFESNNQ